MIDIFGHLYSMIRIGANGLAGMKSFATEVADSPYADIAIYRTLVDGDFEASDVVADQRLPSICSA
jgi:hypothetical protein